MKRPHCRVRVAVEPQVLAGAIAEVLACDGVDEVVALGSHGVTRFDAAVVSVMHAAEADADVVIELPDPEGASRIGRLRTLSGVEPVPITSLGSILRLLDRYCPGEVTRLGASD